MTTHSSAPSTHYDLKAEHYDAFNEERSRQMNQCLEVLLKHHGVHSVLDLACGTGSQVFWLHRAGFRVAGVDINERMLQVARQKAHQVGLSIPFSLGDMRTTQAGTFDAVITMFNAVGHLTREDFQKAMHNIHQNLRPGGVYVFDNFNLDYLLYEDNITKFTVDWLTRNGDVQARKIQYSSISSDGVMASYDIYHEQKGEAEPNIQTAYQTLQVYSAEQLREMLEANGFKVVQQMDVHGGAFHKTDSERVMIVAERL